MPASCRFICTALFGLSLLQLLFAASNALAGEARRGFTKTTIANFRFDLIPNATAPVGGPAETLLGGLDGRIVERYPDATLVEIHTNDNAELKRRGDALSVAVTFRDELDKIFLNGRVLDTREGDDAMPPGETLDPPYKGDEQGTWLIQFVGPVKDSWLADIEALGIVPVQHVPMHAYIVGARRSAVTTLAGRAWVQWTSQLHAFLKPSVGQRTGESSELWIQLPQTDETDDTVSILSALSVGPIKRARSSDMDVRVQGVFQTEDLGTILGLPLVWMIAERPIIDFSDERAALGVTDMVPVSSAVAGRYVKWLTDLCPSCANMVSSDGNDANDFYIGIADTGLDGGSQALSGTLAGEPPASGLLRDEFLPETPRIRWGSSFAPTPEEPPSEWNSCGTGCPDTTGTKHDIHGHGTMVAAVAAGNPPSTGPKDSGGFLFGLGVAPSAGLVITKIMPRRMLYETEDDPTPVRNITRDALISGPGYWQNFSVNQYYDTEEPPDEHCTTMYDGLYSVLSREFDIAVRDGNSQATGAQPITLTVSSGNIDQQLGATTSQCSWMHDSPLTLPPATAKNVIAMGGGENVRADAWLCSGARSDDYANLAFNAKRGTATPGWYKPDLIAVSSNISSVLSNDIRAATVFCPNSPGGEPHPIYRGGTGTSFAAPVGAAAAALASRRYNPADAAAASPALVKAMLVAGAKSMRDGRDRVRLRNWQPRSYDEGDTAIPTNPNGFHYKMVDVVFANGTVQPEPPWPLTPGGEVEHQGHQNKRFVWRNMGEEPRIGAAPNGQQGFGRISLSDVLSAYPARVYIKEEPLAQLSSWSRRFIPHDPSRPVRIAVAWSDSPGVPQLGSAQNPPSPLINNLNLSVEVHESGTCAGRYFGNTLSPGEESVWYQGCAAAPSLDAANNVEVVRFFATPGRGQAGFTVNVSSYSGASQPFSLVVWNAYRSTDPPPPGTPSAFAATPASSSSVTLTWNTAAQTTYELQRSTSVDELYVTIPGPVTSPFTDSDRSPMTTYLYRLRAHNATGASEWTFDTATTAAFTDPVLTSGTTIVKAVHVTELRQAVAAMRTAANLTTAWTDDPLPAPVRAAHMTELRAKLDEARIVLTLPSSTYVDATLMPQSSAIKAVHIQQLRDGVH